MEGAAIVFLDDGDRYMRADFATVLKAVLRPWWEELDATAEQAAASWAAIARAEKRR